MKKYIFLIGGVVGFGIFIMIGVYFLVSGYSEGIYYNLDDIGHRDVAIVFGAGIKDDGSPSDALKDRLISAAELYDAGLVDKILVSGDNRFVEYNEPESMYEYLVNVKNIPSEDVVRDYAGRRTFDTCKRAIEIFDVKYAILVTQEFHLTRALFYCNSLGVDSVGYSASRQEYVFSRYYEFREFAGKYFAFFEIYFWEPDYIGGEKEPLFN